LVGGAGVAKHIVAINDSAEILQLYSEILEVEGGYKVTLLTFRPNLVEEVKSLQPDLIITDYKFREEDVGYNLIQSLRMDRETASLPVIVVSAAIKELRDGEGFLKSKDVGVLFKPFDVDELLDVVAQRLSGGSSRPDGNASEEESAGQERNITKSSEKGDKN
jgi:two-component system response regulator VicR